jgi:metal-responsive CopG/Arc/MetJ family transcriptional regulator
MAKVMISLPDELLDRFDALARRSGATRSGLLQELMERRLATDADARRKAIREMLDGAGHHGGDNARHVREMRDAR